MSKIYFLSRERLLDASRHSGTYFVVHSAIAWDHREVALSAQPDMPLTASAFPILSPLHPGPRPPHNKMHSSWVREGQEVWYWRPPTL
ncbi:uncharacterized protein SPSK_05731 [Sporothrix schenckii 1099-18]|uniref:Uncharacterized protein n=1 Tax=Sporothrix schenckii 1099-18 TaxID=1397361 RepID=A0A0F2LSY3_SPOSC|nr:uncharacterized protein SPSK_05731 [Sporothrix schenckii 1099-18]KJR80598.1 hypothetical protein SPSK_05731 [Sporothrix schenckii 1099-18]